jgi:phage-related protein
VFGKLKEFSSSKQLAEFKDFVKTQAAVFGKTLYDVTKSVGDLVKGAAERVSNIAGQAADTAMTATKKAADVASQAAEKVSDLAGQAAYSTVSATKTAVDTANQAAGSVSDAASEMVKSIGENIKGSTGNGQ